MSHSQQPCAACKLQRRKCTQECIFAPHFPPDQPQKFANIHKVFGASNVAKLRLRRQQRRQAAQRDPRRAARRRRQLPRLRGGGPAQRPGLRLRRLHLQAPAPPQAAPIGPPPRPAGARQVHRPSRPAPYFLRFRRPKLPRKPLCFRPLDAAAAAAAADQLPDDGYSDRVGFTRYDPRKYPTSAAATISSPAPNAADVRGCPATGDVEGL
ncbi:unnamed protein product [Linum tenue]|uniref:LOB domain-containing protein n=1 Tax=Linum tenue TaxID=586396 RepID=A0AAV0RB34_9ROSI|nr:unnamed protein product [Linum tenue]